MFVAKKGTRYNYYEQPGDEQGKEIWAKGESLKHFTDTTWKGQPPQPKGDEFPRNGNSVGGWPDGFSWHDTPCTQSCSFTKGNGEYWVSCAGPFAGTTPACEQPLYTDDPHAYRYYCTKAPAKKLDCGSDKHNYFSVALICKGDDPKSGFV
jgi:hypothetical protein